jgi:hypothetical protein
MPLTIFAQNIKGIVVDSITNKPLAYVNVGVVNSSFGCITNTNGLYQLKLDKKVDTLSFVRYSMLGYDDKIIALSKAFQLDSIYLQKKDIMLDEVILTNKSFSKKKKFGTKKKSKHGICGWGGNKFGSGHEIGLAINLGKKESKIEKLKINIYNHSYKNSLLRLHIRDLKDGLPNNEILNKNILIPINKKSGWVTVDLSKENIIISGKIVLTVEWISAKAVVRKRVIAVNKQKTPSILIYTNRKQGELFIRKGSELPWRKINNQSPNMYIEVKQEF